MDYTICRLCLNVSNQEMWQISDDCDILRKIRSCLNFNLKINKLYPNRVCKQCVNKIEEIYEFWTKAQQNELKLQEHLENNTLQEHVTLLCNTHIKEEKLQKHVFKDDHLNFNGLPQTTYKEKEINGFDTNEANDIIKEEDQIDNDIYSSEEDNITLSSLKEDKYITETRSIKLKDVLQNYNCLTCDKIFNSHNTLKDHYKVEHANISKETVKTTYTEAIINGKVMYKCEKCHKVYSKKYMKTHMFYHMNERPFICKLCGRTYKTVSDIMRHGYRAHSSHKLYCSYKCGFSTAYTGALKAHEDKIHKNVYKYTCNKCDKCFSVKTWYDQHQNIHTGAKPFVCDVCGAAFHMDKYLTAHRNAIHPQSMSKKPLVCPYCDLKCGSAHSLGLHLEAQHSVIKSKSNNKKKKTLCDFCGKILNRPEQLVLHRRMHLGEKPYKCSVCGKSFPRKFSMQVHERRHAGGAAGHACILCGRTYSQPSALYRHQRQHHGLSQKETHEQKANILK